jgi:uncharacterized RDD family membrane protein YckC
LLGRRDAPLRGCSRPTRWIAFDRRKQGWHDKLAGTVVVRPKLRGAETVRFGG